MLLASFPMYELPGLRGDWAALWRHLSVLLRKSGQAAPAALTRPHDLHRHWRDRRMLLSHTCAKPVRDGLWRHVSVLGAFDFGLPGCLPGQYRSALICRANEGWTVQNLLLRGRPVVNGTDGQSGYGALRDLGADLDGTLVSGAHLRSVEAVRRGLADYAAIDAVTWRYLQRWPGASAGLGVAGWTPPTPATPLITARGRDAGLLRKAIPLALDRLPVSVRRRLEIRGFVPLPESVYLG